MKPKVTIVVPAHNEAAYIRDCLKSLARQTAKVSEIIVVDNNSTDKTVKIAKQFRDVRILSESAQGISFANKRGMDAAGGDIIVRIDADTRLPNDWLARVLTRFADSEVAVVTGPGYFYDLPIAKPLHVLLLKLYFRFWRRVQGYHTLWASNMAIRRTVWQEVSPKICLHQKIHEDFDLALHLGRKHLIVFDPSLIAAVSLRRLRRIREYGAYMLMWPRTILFHRRRF